MLSSVGVWSRVCYSVDVGVSINCTEPVPSLAGTFSAASQSSFCQSHVHETCETYTEKPVQLDKMRGREGGREGRGGEGGSA